MGEMAQSDNLSLIPRKHMVREQNPGLCGARQPLYQLSHITFPFSSNLTPQGNKITGTVHVTGKHVYIKGKHGFYYLFLQ